ncbi:bzip transcription factor [Grosmannia clavigera kw1407]|uniref:Bzip transcription factor n=1 Tax=Grosmannia clavigera (strain kw1407 / UAMH 11150) TaxID=655863 RepID=F0XQA8_GROCL|nr:bzip transcription factor [Grosmannia clavigera kw1407]EFX00723.1 bzip transcription factor [Grosmannia clavigera kw1407]
MADIMSMDKNDNIKHDSDDSLDSGDEGMQAPNGSNHAASNSQDGQPVKRKGGRKPIYATSEERKQRNRQAQAAFRERRTEYIKQLEETIRVHEQNLHNLQTAHRHAADECLMLRYKNSLLERILLEKGIDVQAELRAKTGSPSLGPTHMPQNMVQPPPIPRSILNRHHARRSNSSIAPKLEPGVASLPGHPTPTSVVASPKSRPTPSSHSASPTASTSAYGASPAASINDPSSSIRPVLPVPPPPPQMMQAHQAHQAHQAEYDAADDMIEDPNENPDTPAGPYANHAYSTGPPPLSLASPAASAPPSTASSVIGGQNGYPSMTQLLDPALDWDPFGLSASMQFPTQFSFDTSNTR